MSWVSSPLRKAFAAALIAANVVAFAQNTVRAQDILEKPRESFVQLDPCYTPSKSCAPMNAIRGTLAAAHIQYAEWGRFSMTHEAAKKAGWHATPNQWLADRSADFLERDMRLSKAQAEKALKLPGFLGVAVTFPGTYAGAATGAVIHAAQGGSFIPPRGQSAQTPVKTHSPAPVSAARPQ